MDTRISRTAVVSLLIAGTLAAGCQREADPNLTAEIKRLNSELEDARLKLETADKSAVTKRQDAATAVAAEAATVKPPEPDTAVVQKDAQISALHAELAEIKKRDAFAFAEASAAMRKGPADAALERYEKFLKDFPKSPLTADADRAITELTATAQREARSRAMLADPRPTTRETLEHFNDGTVTVKEIAPLLKNRSAAEVVKLLGPPNQTYRDGKEIGYIDRVIDTSTGNKGTLVIGFESDSVTTLRVGYLGKPIKP